MTKNGQTVMMRSAGQSEDQRVDHGHAVAADLILVPAADHVVDAEDDHAHGIGTRGENGAASVILKMLFES